MARDTLGAFEVEIVEAMISKPDDAYSVTIAEALEKRTGRLPALGAVYTALERLERKGYVTSRWGEPTQIRGGRRKRLYFLSAEGSGAYQRTMERHSAVTNGRLASRVA